MTQDKFIIKAETPELIWLPIEPRGWFDFFYTHQPVGRKKWKSYLLAFWFWIAFGGRYEIVPYESRNLPPLG